MNVRRSAESTLALHGVRVLGDASPTSIATLYSIDADSTTEHLLDAEAFGWVRRSSFAGRQSWSLTDRGRDEGERLLAEELDIAGTREDVVAAHEQFRHLNQRIGELMTRWQLRPTRDDPLAFNDHRDPQYDDWVVRQLDRLVEETRPVTDRLGRALDRLGVHQPRIDQALNRIKRLENAWVDSPTLPSLNIVWIQLHEDLLATLNLPRGSDAV